jgi:hypothetical protein
MGKQLLSLAAIRTIESDEPNSTYLFFEQFIHRGAAHARETEAVQSLVSESEELE